MTTLNNYFFKCNNIKSYQNEFKLCIICLNQEEELLLLLFVMSLPESY